MRPLTIFNLIGSSTLSLPSVSAPLLQHYESVVNRRRGSRNRTVIGVLYGRKLRGCNRATSADTETGSETQSCLNGRTSGLNDVEYISYCAYGLCADLSTTFSQVDMQRSSLRLRVAWGRSLKAKGTRRPIQRPRPERHSSGRGELILHSTCRPLRRRGVQCTRRPCGAAAVLG